MATVLNVSSVAQLIPSLGLTVAPGASFDCPDEVAAELVERPDFAKPTPPKPAAGKSKES
jgi:hypothetical protein